MYRQIYFGKYSSFCDFNYPVHTPHSKLLSKFVTSMSGLAMGLNLGMNFPKQTANPQMDLTFVFGMGFPSRFLLLMSLAIGDLMYQNNIWLIEQQGYIPTNAGITSVTVK